MKIISSLTTVACLVMVLCLASVGRAQDPQQPTNTKQPVVVPTPDPEHANLLGQLGLSNDQVQQIRQMNAARKPMVEAANKRLREANRNLDQAIYGDVPVDPADFDARLKEFQSAQADVARIRFESELNVRRILTPEQLVKFRDIRRRAAEAIKQMRQQQIRPLRPNQQFRQLNRNQQPLRQKQ